MTRGLSSIFVLSCVFCFLSCGGGGSGTPSAQVRVLIPVNASGLGAVAYGTNPLVVKIGTVVIWKNNDSMPHTATADGGLWDSGPIGAGATYTYQFNRLGTFNYHCTIHGSIAMSGQVSVQP